MSAFFFQWEQFAIPELNNFLKILDLEEEEYINQVKLKYKMMHENIQEVMNTFSQSDVSETS